MQSIAAAALLLLLLPVASALPSPQATVVLPNACTQACANEYSCIASFPGGCICWNDVYASCAAQCGQDPAPTDRDCTVSKKRATGCVATCKGKYFCTQVWPQSCYCANAIEQRCAEQCGVEVPAQNECPA